MPLTKEQKKNIVNVLKNNITKQKAMVFVSVKGLKASELFDLRKQLKELSCLLSVVKKTLLKIAFKENKIELNEKKLNGELALIFGFEDELAPAKTAYNFSLKNENLKILGGFLEDNFRDMEEIIALARIPSKQELLVKVIGSIKAPLSGFTNVLQGNIKGLITVLAKAKT